MDYVLEKDKKFVYKIYSSADKAVQLTEEKKQAMGFRTHSQANDFIIYMRLIDFNIKTR